ncbi:hypothetical protein CPB83DRAFT_890694 [Crepidotus variabilis]|uniref:Uncharacterized protein n=1 Tax=Crepidotus variabilis TaxID=179855 RepID=A0A9P6EPB3_9AGAR|nr:hypothetical protein CPB83DRAFT_890694 [Crepidotus variabilis]
MPGANYMGGKHNVMKARAKDTVARQQKGFFGRKRLDMLAKGFSCSTNANVSRSPPNFPIPKQMGPQDIALAHARAQQNKNDSDGSSSKSYIPSPIHVSNSSPRSKKRLRTNQAHTSSPEMGKSVILDTLDTTEPLFLRMIMDRILTMPDLAALNNVGERQSSPIHRRNRKRMPNEIEDIEEAESDIFGSRKGSSSGHIQIDNKDYGLQDTERESTENLQNDDVMADDIQDSGYTESCNALIDDLDSEWSIQDPWPSSGVGKKNLEAEPSSDSLNSFRQHLRRSSSQMMLVESSAKDTPITSKETHIDTERGLPSLVTFERAMQDRRTVYGTLFEQEDPWRTIGTILGIEDDQASNDESASENYFQEESHNSFLLENFVEEEPSPQDIRRVSLRNPSGSTSPTADSESLFEVRSKEQYSSKLSITSSEVFQTAIEGEDVALPGNTYEEDVQSLVWAHPERLANKVRTEMKEPSPQRKEDILESPELPEVNGLYLGPSLFSNLEMEESDEDAD